MNEATYTVSADDLAAANRLHFRKLFSARGWLLVFLASAVALALVIFGLDGHLDPESYLVALGSVWAIVAGICVFGWLMIPRQAQRSWNQAQKLWAEQHLTWDADKIHFKSDRGEVHVRWGDYHRWAANDRSLLLYQDDRTFYLVPLRNLPPEAPQEMIQCLTDAGIRER